MYCYHCGKKINEQKLESKQSSYALCGCSEEEAAEIPEDVGIAYACPRCGHLIHEGHTEGEIKALSRASHAQIQRARNFLAAGLGSLSIGAICLIISVLFFFLAKKPSNQYQLVTSCAEFYVFVVLLAIGVTLLAIGAVYALRGLFRARRYESLLKDINDRTFVQ